MKMSSQIKLNKESSITGYIVEPKKSIQHNVWLSVSNRVEIDRPYPDNYMKQEVDIWFQDVESLTKFVAAAQKLLLDLAVKLTEPEGEQS